MAGTESRGGLKYEYTIAYLINTQQPVEQMNALGAEGWELVSVSDLHAFFKREIAQNVVTQVLVEGRVVAESAHCGASCGCKI